MSFRDLFPWTYASGRFLLRSTRGALIAALFLFAFSAICFRIESAIFHWRFHSTLKKVAGIKLDETSDRELLQRIPSLSLEPLEQQARDTELRRCSSVDGDVENGFLIKLVTIGHGQPIDRLLSTIGHRFHRFGVTALIQNGKVVKIGYFLWLDDTRNHNMYQGIGIDVAQYSHAGWEAVRDKNAISYAELAPYVETVASNAPENVLHILTTSDTPDPLKRATFEVRLACLYSFTGCQNTREILPEVRPPRFSGRHRNLEDPFQNHL